MSYIWTLICGFTIIIPALAGIIRLSKIHSTFYPFIVLLWVELLNEVASYFTAKYYRNTAMNSDVYSLLEVSLILWQFYRWQLYGNRRIVFIFLPILLLSAWIADTCLWGSIFLFNSYFKILAFITIVILSISMVSKILGTERKALSKNPIFIICLCFIIFYSYSGVIEVFWKYGLRLGAEWEIPIYSSLNYINVLVYIFYTYAILCMRKKLRFTMLS